MSTTIPATPLNATEEATLILNIIAAVGAPISLSNWPLYVFEATELGYSLYEQQPDTTKTLVEQVINKILDQALHLNDQEKQQLELMIDHSLDATIQIVLANKSKIINCCTKIKNYFKWK